MSQNIILDGLQEKMWDLNKSKLACLFKTLKQKIYYMYINAIV